MCFLMLIVSNLSRKMIGRFRFLTVNCCLHLIPTDEYRGVPGWGEGGCPACSAQPDLQDSPGEARICFSRLWGEMMQGHLARRMCGLDGRFSDPVIPGSPLQYGKALYQHMRDPSPALSCEQGQPW